MVPVLRIDQLVDEVLPLAGLAGTSDRMLAVGGGRGRVDLIKLDIDMG